MGRGAVMVAAAAVEVRARGSRADAQAVPGQMPSRC